MDRFWRGSFELEHMPPCRRLQASERLASLQHARGRANLSPCVAAQPTQALTGYRVASRCHLDNLLLERVRSAMAHIEWRCDDDIGGLDERGAQKLHSAREPRHSPCQRILTLTLLVFLFLSVSSFCLAVFLSRHALSPTAAFRDSRSARTIRGCLLPGIERTRQRWPMLHCLLA